MRALPIGLLLGLVATSPAQEIKLDVYIGGKKGGVATYELSTGARKTRITRLRMSLLDGSLTYNSTVTDAFGAMVKSDNVVKRGSVTEREQVTFDAKGDATITTSDGKKTLVRFDKKGSRRDPSELWFRSVKPSNATWAMFRSLDTRKGVWETVKVTYVGKKPSAKGLAHLVEQLRNGKTTRFYLDDQGLPLLIEADGLRMVRK